MKINWKLRLQNKYTVVSLAACIVTFVYNILDAFAVVPPVEQASVMSIIETVVMVLAGLGILVDPTTAGASDSELAMSRESIK